MTAIPSPAEAVAAALSSAGAEETATNPLAGILKKPAQEAATEAKTEATETKTDAKTETKPDTVPVKKSLAESIVSDEAPAPEVKKVEAPDEPRDGEKPAAFIKRLKQERADALAQLKQLQEKAGQRTEASPDEIAALRKELEERDALLETDAFEKSRKYQEQHAKPIEKATNAAKDLISKLSENKRLFAQAMAMEPKERLELLKEEVGDGAATVFDRLARIEELTADRDAAIKDRAQMSKSLAEEREKQNGAEILKAFDAQRESITSKLSAYRGDQAEGLVKQARSLLTGEAPAEDVVAAAYLAPALPFYISELKASRAENATLKARIAEYEGDKPELNGRGGDTTTDASKSFFKDGRILPVGEVVGAQLAALGKK